MASAEAVSELDIEYSSGVMPDQAPVPLPVARWRVQASHTKADEESWIGLVHLHQVVNELAVASMRAVTRGAQGCADGQCRASRGGQLRFPDA